MLVQKTIEILQYLLWSMFSYPWQPIPITLWKNRLYPYNQKSHIYYWTYGLPLTFAGIICAGICAPSLVQRFAIKGIPSIYQDIVIAFVGGLVWQFGFAVLLSLFAYTRFFQQWFITRQTASWQYSLIRMVIICIFFTPLALPVFFVKYYVNDSTPQQGMITTGIIDATLIKVAFTLGIPLLQIVYTSLIQERLNRWFLGQKYVIPIHSLQEVAVQVENGNQFLNQKQYEEALTSFDQAIAFSPQYIAAWVGKGGALANLQRYEEALTALEQATALNPQYFAAWVGKSSVLTKLLRYEEANDAIDQSIALNPQQALAWINKGFVLDRMKQYEKAITAYDKAIVLDPRNPYAWVNKGVALRSLNRNEEALTTYDQAIAFNPQFSLAFANKGTLLAFQGQITLAEYAFTTARTLDSNLEENFGKEDWIAIGIIATFHNQYDQAISAFDRANTLDPTYAETWRYRSLALQQQSKTAEANSALEEYRRLGGDLSSHWSVPEVINPNL